MSPEPILSIQNLSVAYHSPRGTAQAVRNITLDVQPGETLALIGESGCGKTTLGLSLLRLLPPNASITSGKIIYRGLPSHEIDVLRLNANALRQYRWKQCAMVFQAAQNTFNPVLKIADHFADTAKAHGALQGKTLKERGYHLLELVQLEPERVWNAYAHELSGGMRQRVLIALCLLLAPPLIILDEPTSALDVLSQRNIINIMKELRKSLVFSTIFISHDLALAAELADRVATLYAGEVVELGNVRDIFKKPRHPYTRGLMRAIPTLTAQRDEIQSIPGAAPDLTHAPAGCSFHPRCSLADAQCQKQAPTLETAAAEHQVACWHWQKA